MTRQSNKDRKGAFNGKALSAACLLKQEIAKAVRSITDDPRIIEAIAVDDRPDWLYRQLLQVDHAPKVIEDLKKFDEHIIALNAAFGQRPAALEDIEWVKAKLRHMVEVDQYSRGWGKDIAVAHSYSPQEKDALHVQRLVRGIAIDLKNTADMKELVERWGWFTISQFGREADSNAWLLVQHADYALDFQEKVLGVLEKLYLTGETRPANYAYLFDRVARSCLDQSKQKPQRYGTQLSRGEGGEMTAAPVEDPEHLDERRKKVGLEPMAEYLKRFR